MPPAPGANIHYPWGDQFQVQRANSQATGSGDTQVVGSYQPIGDSPWGASDMAGNVAEWTASNVGKDPAAAGADAPDRFLVKGGSFQDAAGDLAVSERRRSGGYNQCAVAGISLCGKREQRPGGGTRRKSEYRLEMTCTPIRVC